ncbi:hypothetical protein Q7C36_016901 [Tachysurus vachellii]|uniref:Roundabout 2 n=1 Tax=Tachysurus vachellii TaxID=175792 RepID=A0AA88M7M7_TACVA|nr:hypothetical protein Q7C36_016901 [Tachysurus vachellii]
MSAESVAGFVLQAEMGRLQDNVPSWTTFKALDITITKSTTVFTRNASVTNRTIIPGQDADAVTIRTRVLSHNASVTKCLMYLMCPDINTTKLTTILTHVLRDDFRQNPTDVVVAAGEPAILECVPPRGHPEPTTYWKKDKVRIDDRDDRIKIRGGKLMITNTRKSDAGMYVCVGTNMVGERDSETAQVTVFERPTFQRRPINQVILEEEAVEFRCQVHGDPQPSVRWRKDDVDVQRGRYDIRFDKEEHVLRIKKASTADEGTFTCVAENRVGKMEASGTLTVRAPPQFVIRPRDQIVAQGRTATFPCETKGNPQPAVFWQKEGSQNLLFPNQPQQPNSRFSVSPSGDLTIMGVQRADGGYYICQALTVAGSILAKAQLEVTDVLTDRPPPIIRQGPANQSLGVDSVALLKCQASGEPVPTISWLKDGVSLLGKDPRMSLQELGSLQIKNIRLSDSGIYTCVAASSSGETSWSAFLEVKESGGMVLIKNRENVELPGPPSKPQVTDVTKNSVSLSWQPGLAGGSPITSYVIEAFSQSVSNSWQTVADHVKTTQFTVKSLRPNTIYLFMVRAVNTQGLSDPSPMSEPVRTQDISPPAKGIDHRHVQKELGEVIIRLHNPVVLSPTTIQVTWTVDRQSQFIQGYRVLYRQVSGLSSPGPWLTQDVKVSSERTIMLSSLKKGIVYEVKVRPYFNDSQRSPQQVTVLTVGNQNSTSISISWDPIWCLANETRFHVNKTVDAAIRSVVVAGCRRGCKDFRDVIVSGDKNNSITEQITDVVKQPAFIAGIGGACWVILMGFSIWLYWRRKKRKGLSNYAGSMVNGWGSASEEDERPFSSHRSSAGSSSDGSLFTHCSFARALAAAADKAGYRLDGTSLTKRDQCLALRPRPASPFSTDGSTMGTHSLGHVRAARPARKNRGPGTAVHRRDTSADDLPPPPEPPPCQGLRVQGPRSVGNVGSPGERKASSLERHHMGGRDEVKSSLERQTRTSLERHRHGQERLGSMERAEEARRAQKNGTASDEAMPPYSKPSFPSPGGHSSSGTTSSKGSTGPRKGEGSRGQHQRSNTEQGDSGYAGTNGQGQFSGELFDSEIRSVRQTRTAHQKEEPTAKTVEDRNSVM